ncbi:hypothetical protein CVU76_02430 [Candidatus Dojkabacteria bacterium HGW-Dojkabacteria-1]|uniref:dCTP deaminase n=1 Tax=Candidatus Dojkabacteria bacterium HGW-Dojkabacteria-1 TaxID=2013761 RepID=A0A2N2F3V4_9BACT|nr:MAG: hypothetical protein CVU76_02430 [Candidatus Dojkabacteria bacterium HGW-Dojkabacteria-1]
MFLSNKTIQEYIESGKISVIGDIELESTGLAVHLGSELLIPKDGQTFDSKNPIEIKYDRYNLNNSPYILKPNNFVLGITKQSINTDKDILTMIDGRSTYARAGMTIHLCAMILDGVPFNIENSVLEIKNLGNCNILLHPGEKIGTYLFAKLSSSIEGEKDSKYTNQNSVIPPQF